jgi:hypothetical protein
MAEATEHHEPTLDRKAIAVIVILLSLVGVLLAELTFDRHTDRSEGPVLAVFGLLYVLSQAHRKLAAWSNGWSWRRFGDFWPWTVIGLDGMRLLNIGVGILMIITGIFIYVRPLL